MIFPFFYFYLKPVQDPLPELKRKFVDTSTDLDEMKRCINAFKSCKEDVDFNDLFVRVFMRTKYDAVQLLLEEGVKPHFIPIEVECDFTVLDMFIFDRNLPKVRFLIWSDPNYENILSHICYKKGRKISIKCCIEAWKNQLSQERTTDLLDIINSVTTDSKKCLKLRSDIQKLLDEKNEKNNLKIAVMYKEIADIYKRQWKIERNIHESDYYTGETARVYSIERFKVERREDNKKFKHAAMQFYAKGAYQHYKKAYELFKELLTTNENKKTALEILFELDFFNQKLGGDERSYSADIKKLREELTLELRLKNNLERL